MASNEDSSLQQSLWASCNDLARRVVRLPVSIIEGISRVLRNVAPRRNPPTNPQPEQQHDDGVLIIPEELLFFTLFEREYGDSHPFFYACPFTEALEIAKDESKLVFLYLHSPENPFTAPFCRDTLCSQLVTEFLDANFVSWGAVANRGEGLEMALALGANTFPFCAVVAPASGKAIAVLQQVEGPVSPEELGEILQRTMDEQGSAFRGLREEEEEARRANRQLRQEQDAAFHDALQKDKEKERAKMLLEENARAAAERSMKERKERLQIHPTAKQSSNKQKETSKGIINSKQKHPVTKILIRFPDGSRKEQSFPVSETIRSIYKYIDSHDLPGIGSYQLIAFPKRIYGYEQLDMTLRDAGLYPTSALFLEKLS